MSDKKTLHLDTRANEAVFTSAAAQFVRGYRERSSRYKRMTRILDAPLPLGRAFALFPSPSNGDPDRLSQQLFDDLFYKLLFACAESKRGENPTLRWWLPIPKAWRHNFWPGLNWSQQLILAAHWIAYVALCYAKGVRRALQIIRCMNQPDVPPWSSFSAIAFGINENCLGPLNGAEASDYQFIPWLHRKLGDIKRKHSIGLILSGASHPRMDWLGPDLVLKPWPPLRQTRRRLRCAIYLVGTLIRGISLLLQGHWQAIVLLRDALESRYMSHVAPSDIPGMIIAPWHGGAGPSAALREAHQRGSRLVLWFYSCSDYWIVCDDVHTPPNPDSRLLKWPELWVWDSYQLDYLRGNCPRLQGSKFEICGPIPFTERNSTLAAWPSPSVGVFPVTPNDLLRKNLGLDGGYISEALVTQFVADIMDVASKLNIHIVFKDKRRTSSENRQPDSGASYSSICETLSGLKNATICDPGCAASRVIEGVDVVVSIPFTSPGVIAVSLGKPSIWYDPSGLINKTQPAGRGLPLASSREEMESLLRAVLGGLDQPGQILNR